MKEFDKVYLINLDNSQSRLKKVKKELQKNKIDFNRVSAISGDSINKEKYPITETEGWNYNAIGLTLTTIKILEDAIKNNYERIFIFEDDAILSLHFEYQYSLFIKNVPRDWQFLLLNFNDREPSTYVNRYVRLAVNSTCCQAYGINKSVYKEYLKRLKEFSKPIDEHTVDLQKKETTYCSLFNIVSHSPHNYSTLREKVVNY
jgi:GR25 family glycosyltransferase involved in LPS biosynthesis